MKLQLTIIGICMTIMSHAIIKTPCVKIVLNSGRVIEAAILALDSTEIRYKKCGQTTDIDYFVSKEAILVIKNGQDEVIFARKQLDYNPDKPDNQKEYEPNAIWALVFAPFLPLLTAIFGTISAKRTRDAPYKYKLISPRLVKWAYAITITLALVVAVALAITF